MDSAIKIYQWKLTLHSVGWIESRENNEDTTQYNGRCAYAYLFQCVLILCWNLVDNQELYESLLLLRLQKSKTNNSGCRVKMSTQFLCTPTK